MKKLRSNRGETLLESLVSMVIISLVAVFLASSIVAAAKVNAAADNSDYSFHTGTAADENYTVSILQNGTKIAGSTVTRYETDNGYVYYESND